MRKQLTLFIFLISVLSLIIALSNVTAYEIFYYHSDSLGSPVAITDGNGSVVWRTDYKPFGQSLNEVSEDGVNNYQYNAKEKDDSGLFYYGARYYDADLGRFVTADTIGGNIKTPQTLNRYVYTLNNPLKFIDPTGKIAQDSTRTSQLPPALRFLENENYAFIDCSESELNKLTAMIVSEGATSGLEINVMNAVSRGETVTDIKRQRNINSGIETAREMAISVRNRILDNGFGNTIDEVVKSSEYFGMRNWNYWVPMLISGEATMGGLNAETAFLQSRINSLDEGSKNYWKIRSDLEVKITGINYAIDYYQTEDLTNIKMLMDIARQGAVEGLNPWTKSKFEKPIYYFGFVGDIGASPRHMEQNIIGETGSGDVEIYFWGK